ncbi:receptor-like protein 6 [Cannabis sativa]|uniref:receptor-like protein 6 n=1 Tax=Cannabis sativa TaxID=3483 RepID=UPI0029C9EDF3|nr:receptor-like protein 6 [Cannabis sativa]
MALMSSLVVMFFKLVLLFHPLLLLSNHHPFVNSVQPFCHDEERSALIHFNQSFEIDCQPRVDKNHQFVPIYPKTSTWGSNGTNCCAWDGVECDLVTGHVTGLNLSGSCLYGSIYSNSTLFHLVHLQKLHLAFNNFTFSPIPTTIAVFSELTFLNLGYSFFQGEIPTEVSLLSKLYYLYLSGNVDGNNQPLSSLKLEKINLESLAKNLTTLSILVLNYVDMRYELGDSLANLTSLTQLQLWGCGLYGPIPSSIGKLSQLNLINLHYNSFAGYIPSSFQNLTLLSTMSLTSNQISGTIPSWFGNLTELKRLDIASNNLTGSVPPSLSNLKNLEFLRLINNSLSGTLKFDYFLKLKNLYALGLGYNMISLLLNDERKRELNTTLPKLRLLDLGSCNLSRFPDFIVHQNNLVYMDLSYNHIHGQIPKDLMNSSLQSLEVMDLSNNWITGFQNYTTILPWSNLRAYDMQSNLLQGKLPIPPSSIRHYDMSNNILSGQIPSSICNLSSILVLELSNNNLSGEFPLCSGSGISDSILVLNLRNNSFHGTIPLQCQPDSKLRMVDFSHNHFQGKLQQPFTICMNLEYLDFSFNQLSDVFPTWLGSFTQLRVVLMRENEFHGVIGNPQNTTNEFAKLQIIDLSHNYFTGAIPFEYMLSWNAMKDFKMSNLTYMNALENITYNTGVIRRDFFKYDYSTTFVLKSVATHYGKIPMNLAVIDLSSNNFSGQIPEIIGNLKALYSLNLSNNALNGRIPPSLGTLTELESLDLSQNQLSGEIPQQLTDLKFLQKFDVSYNNLTGLIPRENQFHTFENNSFEGNEELCGEPLSKKCGDSLLPPSTSNEDDDSDSGIELDWKFILAGLMSGLVIGVSVGEMLIPRTRLAWFVYISRTRLREMMIRN